MSPPFARPAGGGTPAPVPTRRRAPRATTLPRFEPLYNVVLIDDDEHTYQYVIAMLCKLFGHAVDMAFRMAREVDASGRVIVDTTHQERAELKREEIQSFGPDPLIPHSSGSMRATIEPVCA